MEPTAVRANAEAFENAIDPAEAVSEAFVPPRANGAVPAVALSRSILIPVPSTLHAISVPSLTRICPTVPIVNSSHRLELFPVMIEPRVAASVAVSDCRLPSKRATGAIATLEAAVNRPVPSTVKVGISVVEP